MFFLDGVLLSLKATQLKIAVPAVSRRESVCGADLQQPHPKAASCAALFKEPLVCLKKHLMGKTRYFSLAEGATWPRIIPRWMISVRI